MLGDAETKGFLNFCFTVHDPIHFKCSMALETLSNLFSRTTNPQAEIFVRVFVGLSSSQIAKYKICQHVIDNRMKKCHCASLDMLFRYFKENPLTNLKSLMNPASVKIYEKWFDGVHREPINLNFEASPASSNFGPQPSSCSSPLLAVLRSQDNRAINEDPAVRTKKLMEFYTQGKQKTIQAFRNRQVPAVFKEINIVNHDFVYLSINPQAMKPHLLDLPPRTNFQRIHHDQKENVMEFRLRDCQRDYEVIFRYSLSSEPSLNERVFKVDTRAAEKYSSNVDHSIDHSLRKGSYNLSSSTHCDEDSMQAQSRDSVRCHFEGNVRFRYNKHKEIDQIDICLVALTEETTGFFASQKLSDPELYDLISGLIQA